MVLDDDPSVTVLIEAATGFTAKTFAAAKDLLDQVENLVPLAIFVDVHLSPVENGLDCIPILRRHMPFTPILVVTADDNDDAVAQALSAGANDFVRKPINRREIASRLRVRTEEMLRMRMAEQVQIGDVVYNRRLKMIAGKEGKRQMTPKEAMMFESVILSHGMLIERVALKQSVWGDIKVTDGAFDKMLHQLRASLKDVSQTVSIVSVYGTGVALRVSQAEVPPAR